MEFEESDQKDGRKLEKIWKKLLVEKKDKRISEQKAEELIKNY